MVEPTNSRQAAGNEPCATPEFEVVLAALADVRVLNSTRRSRPTAQLMLAAECALLESWRYVLTHRTLLPGMRRTHGRKQRLLFHGLGQIAARAKRRTSLHVVRSAVSRVD